MQSNNIFGLVLIYSVYIMTILKEFQVGPAQLLKFLFGLYQLKLGWTKLQLNLGWPNLKFHVGPDQFEIDPGCKLTLDIYIVTVTLTFT